MNALEKHLRALTVNSLTEWVGKSIVAFGQRHVDRVHELVRLEDGTLGAWVHGRHRYATLVRVGPDGCLDCACTCACGDAVCKHAVAVILAAAGRITAGDEISRLDENGELYREIFKRDDQCARLTTREVENDASVLSSGPVRCCASFHREELESLSRAELIDIVIELHRHYPGTRQLRQGGEASGQSDSGLRRLATEFSADLGWHSSRQGKEHPDYQTVLEQFRGLRDSGQIAELVSLGEQLWSCCRQESQQTGDEVETFALIKDCLAVVVEALPLSALGPTDRVRWVLERALDDGYGLLGPVGAFLANQELAAGQWSELAQWLHGRLDTMNPHTSGLSSRRQILTDWLVVALRAAGREHDVLPLLEGEVRGAHNYEFLVDILMDLGHEEMALKWCREGFEKTCASRTGIASRLHKRLRDMAVASHLPDMAAAYVADAFFDHPDMAGFADLQQAVLPLGCWEQVRSGVLEYLVTGVRPDIARKGNAHDAWPLPEPGVRWPFVTPRQQRKRFPDFALLIKIAIYEKRPEDVVRLNAQRRRDAYSSMTLDLTVAQAVVSSHPRVALDIWRKKADSLIAQVKPRAYVEAVEYLGRMRTVFQASGRMEDWVSLLADLRKSHKSKRRLMEQLDLMEKNDRPV